MIKKVIGITTAAVLTLGIASFAYANEKDDKAVNQPIKTEITTIANQSKDDIYDDMLDIMKKNGYKDLAKEVEKGNYKAMDDFMNNITEEDYQKMIDIMKESGNDNMARMMEGIGREEMIEMHKSMGGAESCHGSNGSVGNTKSNRSFNGMMNGNFNGMMNRSL